MPPPLSYNAFSYKEFKTLPSLVQAGSSWMALPPADITQNDCIDLSIYFDFVVLIFWFCD